MSKVLNQIIEGDFAAYHCDCVDGLSGLPDNSIDYSIFSPPFSSLYTYSASDRDMGNSRNDGEFYNHMSFMVAELLRVLKPGRLASFHCMNLPTSKAHDGYIGLRDFRGDLIRLFCGNESAKLAEAAGILRGRLLQALMDSDAKAKDRRRGLSSAIEAMELEIGNASNGFIYHSEVAIWKDPVTAMQRTKALGLLYKQIRKDSAMSRQGIADYLVTVRNPGDNPEPINHFAPAHSVDGRTKEAHDALANPDKVFPVSEWQKFANPVYGDDLPCDVWMPGLVVLRNDGNGLADNFAEPSWMDINPSDTLQFRSAREHSDERHICPLQLQVIRRAIKLWTNPRDIVVSPFMGIGSEGHVSLQEGRRFIGFETKESYYKQAYKNLQSATKTQTSLF